VSLQYTPVGSEEILKRALEREKRARKEAENIAEQVTARLHVLNQELDLKVREAIRDLEQREADLQESHSKVTEALKLRDHFLASMTHELRSPLHSILGLSEVLLEDTFGELNDRQRSSLETIHSSGSHLLQLINNVLEVSKLAAGQSDFELEEVNVPAVCEEAAHLVAAQAATKHIRIELKLSPQAQTLQATTLHLKQILVNLLSNAVKFTPKGGTVVLTTSQDSEKQAVQLTVTDTGIGISEDDFSKLFRPFSQIDSGHERSAEGSGLGLLLVQRMADLYGGGVSVKSVPGEGSAFRVSMPYISAATRQTSSAGQSRKVVLIDDSSVNRAILRRILLRRSFTVLEQTDGLSGIEAVRKEKPFLVVLDLYMPKLDGFDVLRLLKTDPQLRGIPVAVISGVDTPRNQERCMEMGADAYFPKPIQSRRVEAWLDRHLAKITPES
jgi:signal transduction histidine kinase/CheY-like chemotaxis protein